MKNFLFLFFSLSILVLLLHFNVALASDVHLLYGSDSQGLGTTNFTNLIG